MDYKTAVCLWFENWEHFIKKTKKKLAGQRKSSYIIRDDVPDGKCPRCCFCLRPRFDLLHLLQEDRMRQDRMRPDTEDRTGRTGLDKMKHKRQNKEEKM